MNNCRATILTELIQQKPLAAQKNSVRLLPIL